MNPFAPGIGDTVGIRDTDRRCIITNFYPGSLVGVRDCGTRGESEKLHIRLIVPPPPPKENAAPNAEVANGVAHPELSRISEADWEKAKLRYAIIKPFLDASRPRRARWSSVPRSTVTRGAASMRGCKPTATAGNL